MPKIKFGENTYVVERCTMHAHGDSMAIYGDIISHSVFLERKVS